MVTRRCFYQGVLLARWQDGRSLVARHFARSSAVPIAYRNALLGIVTSHSGTAFSHSLVCRGASRSYQRQYGDECWNPKHKKSSKNGEGLRGKKPARRTLLCVVGWNCLPLAQALSIEEAAHSVVGRFATTRERVMVSRSCVYPEQLYVRPQGQTHKVIACIASNLNEASDQEAKLAARYFTSEARSGHTSGGHMGS